MDILPTWVLPAWIIGAPLIYVLFDHVLRTGRASNDRSASATAPQRAA